MRVDEPPLAEAPASSAGTLEKEADDDDLGDEVAKQQPSTELSRKITDEGKRREVNANIWGILMGPRLGGGALWEAVSAGALTEAKAVRIRKLLGEQDFKQNKDRNKLVEIYKIVLPLAETGGQPIADLIGLLDDLKKGKQYMKMAKGAASNELGI